MENNIDSSDATKTVITCEPTIDINYVGTLYDHLKQALEAKHEVEIHAGEVTKVDAAILQLFIAFVLEAKNAGLIVTWMSVSEAFVTSADLLGLVVEMDLPKAA